MSAKWQPRNFHCLPLQSVGVLSMLDSLRPHGPQPTRLLCPWEFSRQEILEWVASSFSRGSSRPRARTHLSWVSCIGKETVYQLCQQKRHQFGQSSIHQSTSARVKNSRWGITAQQKERLCWGGRESSPSPPPPPLQSQTAQPERDVLPMGEGGWSEHWIPGTPKPAPPGLPAPG